MGNIRDKNGNELTLSLSAEDSITFQFNESSQVWTVME